MESSVKKVSEVFTPEQIKIANIKGSFKVDLESGAIVDDKTNLINFVLIIHNGINTLKKIQRINSNY